MRYFTAHSTIQYNRNDMHPGFECWANLSQRDEGFITWMASGAKMARMSAAAVMADQGDDGSEVEDRLILEEPMVRFFVPLAFCSG